MTEVLDRMPTLAGPAAADRGMHAPEAHANLFAVLHKLLRGRYVWLVVLAGLGAVIGGSLGYLLPTPKYSAEGLVRVQPVIPKILYNTEQSSMLPMFASFVNTQVAYLQHSRVLNKAMNSDPWKALGRSRGAQAEDDFRKSLKVSTSRETQELINVSFIDENAEAALVAVRQVILAYQDLYGESGNKDVRETQTTTLNQRRTQFENERREKETALRTISAEFGTSDVTKLHDDALDHVLELQRGMAQVRMRLFELNIDADAAVAAAPEKVVPSPGDPAAAAAKMRSPEEIAAVDRGMASLLAQRAMLEQELRRAKGRGFGDQHSTIVHINAELAETQATIARLAIDWNQQHPASAISGVVAENRTESAPELVDRFRQFMQQAALWQTRMAKLNDAREKSIALQREINDRQTLIAEATQRLDQLSVESKMEARLGRIEAYLPDSPPGIPNVDPRFRYGTMGVVAGGGLPIAIFILLGLIDKRVRYSDQAEGPLIAAPLLGILPQLPARLDDPEQVATAVHCVHQIRTLLRLSGSGRQTYTVTSPTAGDGKTSLALSLGLSFTAAGQRTVLVDFDLIGRGLSQRFKFAGEHGLGHTLVGANESTGPQTTGIDNMWLIPAGRGDSVMVGRITAERFADLLAGLRTQFDVIIVDTGPILGSLEANIAATSTDGVILVVGRGQRQDLIKSAMNHLASLSSRVVGLVFNRAIHGDFNGSHATMSFRSLSAAAPAAAIQAPVPAHLQHLDPLARSLAMDVNR